MGMQETKILFCQTGRVVHRVVSRNHVLLIRKTRHSAKQLHKHEVVENGNCKVITCAVHLDRMNCPYKLALIRYDLPDLSLRGHADYLLTELNHQCFIVIHLGL